MVSSFGFSQKEISCDSLVSMLSRKNSLLFNYENKIYVVDLENYFLKDIHTGNIHLINMSKRVKKRKHYTPERKWDLFMLIKNENVRVLK